MSNQAFETELEQLFDQAPAFDDTAAFAAAVEARLNRTARLRRLLTGGAGAVGGAAALWGLSQCRGLELLQSLSTDFAPLTGGLNGSTLWLMLGLGIAAFAAWQALAEA